MILDAFELREVPLNTATQHALRKNMTATFLDNSPSLSRWFSSKTSAISAENNSSKVQIKENHLPLL